MSYQRKKGHNPRDDGERQRGPVKDKPDEFKFLESTQLAAVLAAVQKDTDNPRQARDHAAIFLCYYLGLRLSECAWLERDCFKWIESGVIDAPTLKQLEPRTRDESGKLLPKKPRPWLRGDDGKLRPPRVRLRDVEHPVREYIAEYLREMPPEQRWLFVGRNNKKPISARMLDVIFNTYFAQAGLSKHFSTHACRHGRGVLIYERFKDPQYVKDMLRHSSLTSTEYYIRLSPGAREKHLVELDAAALKVKPLKRNAK